MTSSNLIHFRSILQRLDPTQPIQSPAHHPWYVLRPDSVAVTLARTLQIDPGSAHLVVGSIGCGKSTELLAAGRILVGTPGIFARYVELSRAMDLQYANAEVLILAALDELLTYMAQRFENDAELAALQNSIKPALEGWREPYWDAPDLDDGSEFLPILKRPGPDVPEPVVDYLPILQRTKEFVASNYNGAELVWLFDGLDRLSDPIEFDHIVEPALKALKKVGIGVALVGPRRVISGLDRLGAVAAFDELHWLGPVSPSDSRGSEFLHSVLHARGLHDVMDLDQIDALIRWSGGAIRILLQLAREAIKETWVRNVARVGPDQIAVAADRIGRGLVLGLSDEDLTVLQILQASGVFASRRPEDSALVLTNRVLEYRMSNGLMHHEIHPTLAPFLLAFGSSRQDQKER